MSRRQQDPLRALKPEERMWLERLSRSQAEPAAHVVRAKMLLAVAAGKTYIEAAQQVGRRSDEAVSALVSRFNQEGVAAVEPRHGGAPVPVYGPAERERILRELRRTPQREEDGGVRWSLSLLQRALQQAPDALPTVSIATIRRVLREAGISWQQARSWCPTAEAVHRRKDGIVWVTDPDAEAKKADRRCRLHLGSGGRHRGLRRMKRIPFRRCPSLVPRGNQRGSPPAMPMSTSAMGQPK